MTNEKMLIVAFPSAGLVGAFAVSYLTSQLGMKDIGDLEFTKISPTYAIKDGEIYGPVRIYNKENLYAILSSIPLNPTHTYDLITKSIEFAKNNNIKKIIIPRGLEAYENKKNDPISYGVAVNKNSKSLLEEYNLPSIKGAMILGVDASVISALKNSEIPCIVLYTTCRMMFPDDDAIIKSIRTLADIIRVKVETEKFEEQLEKISKENEKLIAETKNYFENTSGKSASILPPGIG
ncbi:MAG: PAC2 family protein [Nitrosopumilus sp.]|nr:PAC2 family protein [Nitrosopumilus sp.]MBL7017582.1 PAC2 family protein [Nitrosopumilus sp.]